MSYGRKIKIILNQLMQKQRHYLVRALASLQHGKMFLYSTLRYILLLWSCRLHLKFWESWTIAVIVVKKIMTICWCISFTLLWLWFFSSFVPPLSNAPCGLSYSFVLVYIVDNWNLDDNCDIFLTIVGFKNLFLSIISKIFFILENVIVWLFYESLFA